MNTRCAFRGITAVVSSLLLAASACGGSDVEPEAANAPVVERTTDGNVTTVRNISGSTWGEPAWLVEEMSIGVLEGAEEYMLGAVSSIWATEDRVYVVDRQLPAIRVYDHAGQHLADVGRGGQGPGEFSQPGRLVVLADGTLVLSDFGNRRLVFFDADGEALRTWSAEKGFISGPMALKDGALLVQLRLPREEDDGPFASAAGFAPLNVNGELGELRFPPTFGHVNEGIVLEIGSNVIAIGGDFLFMPHHLWTVRPDGAIVAGVGNQYRFEVHATDGTITAVERVTERVPVHPDEAADAVARLEEQFSSFASDWKYDGEPAPQHKPFFTNIVSDMDNRVWVVRPGLGELRPDCETSSDEDTAVRQESCWDAPPVVEAFAADGTYLGEVQRPEGLTFRAVFIRGDAYWAAVEDEDGLVTVRRFRIVTSSNS